MSEHALRSALLKLHGAGVVPASQFTYAQRSALDQFARQTGAVSSRRKGRGDVYAVANRATFETHLTALSPQVDLVARPDLPLRAQHIAHARDSKARGHHHACHYPVIKAVGEGVIWQDAQRDVALPLSQLTWDCGAASLRIEAGDSWHTTKPLWLVENQALFDRTDWLPPGTSASLLYYGGQLNGLLLGWLASQQRASRIVHFPDYDGVGLANFARLFALLGEDCEFWLMPDWSAKIARYGSNRLWRDTLQDFTVASARLPGYLGPLIRQMQESALALEQESVWLL
jgi:hypothetical protein